jgi:hypothetical protein
VKMTHRCSAESQRGDGKASFAESAFNHVGNSMLPATGPVKAEFDSTGARPAGVHQSAEKFDDCSFRVV